jgi:hypothetical protein
MVGDHGHELEGGRRGRRQHPEAMGPLLYEARAHAALGDADTVSRIADEAVALGSDRFMSAGEVLFTAARELKAHGQPTASVDMLARAIHWERDRSALGSPTVLDRLTLARMHYEADAWSEAAELLSPLQREEPENADVLGSVGTLAARVGNEAAARVALSALRAKTGRGRRGSRRYWVTPRPHSHSCVERSREDSGTTFHSTRTWICRGLPTTSGTERWFAPRADLVAWSITRLTAG